MRVRLDSVSLYLDSGPYRTSGPGLRTGTGGPLGGTPYYPGHSLHLPRETTSLPWSRVLTSPESSFWSCSRLWVVVKSRLEPLIGDMTGRSGGSVSSTSLFLNGV